MKEYVSKTTPIGRRTMLFKHFDGSSSCKPSGHNCCDKYADLCKCQNDRCDVDLHLPLPPSEILDKKERTVTEQEKEKL